MTCTHCHENVLSGTGTSRGLCRPCWNDLEVRASRPLTAHEGQAYRGVGLTAPRTADRPREACPYPPGSQQRVMAYAGRAERGEHLWCEGDANEGVT